MTHICRVQEMFRTSVRSFRAANHAVLRISDGTEWAALYWIIAAHHVKAVASFAMKRADKAQKIMDILNTLYPAPPIPLVHEDPFTLLVAVVLSAQSTDKKVNQITPALFKAAATPEAMAQLSVSKIQSLIREIGLAPQKAKAIAGLSRKLVDEFGGQVPKDFEALLSLPGVGRKTANVVMAQAFGVPSFPVDTHIFRLAHRWGLSRGKTADQTEADLCRIFPKESWNRLHLQIIYFGREYCPALRHDAATCPICSWAAA